MDRGNEQTFFQEDKPTAGRYMGKCSPSLTGGAMHTKATSFHLAPVGMAVTGEPKRDTCWLDVEEREPVGVGGGNVSWCSVEPVWRFFRKPQTERLHSPGCPAPQAGRDPCTRTPMPAPTCSTFTTPRHFHAHTGRQDLPRYEQEGHGRTLRVM